MRRLVPRALLALALTTSFGCSGGAGCRARRAEVDAGSADPRPFVPTTPGDRWRYRVEPTGRHEHVGISAVDANGRAVMHGTDRSAIEFLAAAEDGVFVVSPEGTRLVPVVARPVRTGARTSYVTRQGDADGRCELTIEATDVQEVVAGTTFAGCIRQRRVCQLPAGGGLPRATTFTNVETRCPSVGLVRDTMTISPPLPFEDVPSQREMRLVSFHVRGAPVLPASIPLADRLILLPSDANAACSGTTLRSELRVSAVTPLRSGIEGLTVADDVRPEDSLQAFALRDGPLVVELREGRPEATPAYVGADAAPFGEMLRATVPTRRLGLSEGRAQVRITPPASCDDESIARLETLIRAMVR